ncbi:hypothetical protein [Pseudomonas nitroreducens]|uniref:Uncharacterized protein n=1 Tax=Pseudomonas nitroreducens TaxID=46680 RepID=A0A6G6IT19_PSENT|nr:hypothetical protein [Pseudomonas nitroreducens]QIE86142.1 hypothetical protein G5B91_07645 [Pseudomonas nitroreducens]
MLNGAPLNSAPLNSTRRLSSAPVAVEPPAPPQGFEVPTSGYAYRWSVSVLVDGIQVAARLTGRMQIDREEGAAAVSTFSLFYPPELQVATDLASLPVSIDFISETGGVTTQSRRFTGIVVEPRWSAVNRVMEITCSDNLQQRVEAMDVAAIDTLVGGYWSADVFEAVEGRSRWEYAGERLSTLPASLDASAFGVIRVSSWYAKAPTLIFQPGSTLYQSVSVELAQAQNATNRIELDVDYRYSRLWQRNDHYGWAHPGAGGHEGIQGFCSWRSESTDLPDVAMIEQATEGAGMKLLPGSAYGRVPASSGDPCGNGQPWINRYPDLLLNADWSGARRWVQPITEQCSVLIGTAVGLYGAENRRVIGRESVSFEIEDKRTETWEEDQPLAGNAGATDLRDDARRAAAFECSLHRAATSVVSGHRGTSVSWQVPTPMAIGADLVNTLELADQLRARGKLRRIMDEMDFDAGTAITTLTIASMQGGGVSTPLIPPPKPVVDAVSGSVGHPALATQLGMRNESPLYNDELDGFAGNYDDRDDDINPSLEEFPRRMTITASEISADLRDERKVDLQATFEVGIPNDLLEL